MKKNHLTSEQTLANTQNTVMIAGWAKIGIISGLFACFAYPVMTLVSLPRIPQIILGGGFGPAFAIACISLMHILQARKRTPTLELAGILSALAGALVTAMIIVQMSINYSTYSIDDKQLASLLGHRIWDVVLGLDVAFDMFVGIGTFFFAINMISDKRFGKIIGWLGIFTSIVVILGANFFYFPDPPYVHGFPHVGIFAGVWYLAVTILMIRWVYKDSILFKEKNDELKSS